MARSRRQSVGSSARRCGLARGGTDRSTGADPEERLPAPTVQRNGYRPKLLLTPAEDIEVGIPKLRKSSNYSELLKPHRRINPAMRLGS
jgi:transposase-like protein